MKCLLFLVAVLPSLAYGQARLPPTLTYWPNNEYMPLGDSILGAPGGIQYQPASPIPIAGDIASGSVSVANLSATAGLQVGAPIFGPGIPTGDYIATLTIGTCPSSCSLTLNTAATTTASQAALVAQGNIGVNRTLVMGAQINSAMGWLDAISGNAINWSPTKGYGGNYGGLLSTVIVAGGTGYGPATSWALSAPTGSPAVQAGTMTCTANASGVLQSCSPPNPPGAGYTGTPTLTCTGTCGSGANIGFRLGGSGTFASPGDSTANILARLPDICVARPGIVELDGGTNDIKGGLPAATIIANIKSIVTGLQACGIPRIVLYKILDRSTWISLFTYSPVQAMGVLRRVNRAIESIGRQTYSTASFQPQVVVVDANRWWTDASLSTGYAAAGMTYDGLHPAMSGAFWMAIAEKAAIQPWLSPNTPANFGQDDAYDVNYDPGGNLLGATGLFLGTSGSVGSTACTGTVASGWTLLKGAGTSTPTCALSIENPRTDSLTGQRQVLTFSAASGGSSTEYYRLYATVSLSNVTAGDKLTASCEMNLSNYVNVNRVGIELQEYGQSNNAAYVQHSYGLSNSATAGSNLPNFGVMQNLPLTGILPGFVQGVSGGSFTITPRTMSPLTAQAVSGSVYYLYVDIGFDASVSGTQVALKVSNCAVRKVTA